MHEISMMASIVEEVLLELEKYRVEKIEEVILSVGEMTFLGHEQLRFAFEVISRDTILEGATLTIEKEELEVRCPSCGYSGPVEYLEKEEYHYVIPILHCPRCGGQVEIFKGKRCAVTSLKVVER